MIVTIDGPAGAGKSTAARAVAKRLGWHYLDTGAMYRAVAWAGLDRGVNLAASQRVAQLARTITIAFDSGRVLVDGRDVSEVIRTKEITDATRLVADAPAVREVMTAVQRRVAANADVITEGRDQGTVVFPHAALKIFLTASAAERARRRCEEERARGREVAFEEMLAAQNRRDQADASRDVGPLVPAADAIHVITDGLSHEEVVQRLVTLIRAAEAAAATAEEH
jgi:cytidylate kinase